MKHLLIVVFISLLHPVIAQEITWEKTILGEGETRNFKSIIDSENNTYIVGYFTGSITADKVYPADGSGYDVYVAKYNKQGNLVWLRRFGSRAKDDYADAVTLSKDQKSILISGGFFGSTCDFGDGYSLNNSELGTADGFLVSFNTSDGSVTQAKSFAYGLGGQRPQDMKFDKNGDLVIIGFCSGDTKVTYFNASNFITCNGPQNYFILKFNSSLELIWFKHFTGNDGANKLFSLDVDNAGYYIAGTNKGTLTLDIATLSSNNGSSDMFLYKTDYDGSGQWIRRINGSGTDVSVYSTCDQKGHIYISGYYASTDLKVDSTSTAQSLRTIPNKGGNDIFFAKYNTEGTLQWFDIAGSSGDDRVTRLSTNGNYIVIAGQFGGEMTLGNEKITPKGKADALGIVHDKDDNLLYAITAGGAEDDVAQSCVIDSEGNYIFTGDFYSPTITFDASNTLANSKQTSPYTRDVFIAKYKARSVTLNTTPIKCNVLGSISANPKGAWVANRTFSWTKEGDASFNSNSQIITNLEAGTYMCVVSDGTYSETASVTLTSPVPPSIAEVVSSHKEAKCFEGTDGAFTALATGGTLPYSYLTTGTGSGIVANQPNQTALSAGMYKVTVTDAYGCSASTNDIEIKEPSKINFKGTVVTKINGSSGSVTLAINGGTPAYSDINWTGPAGFTPVSGPNLSGLSIAGNYKVTLKDLNLCTADTTVQIVNSHSLFASITEKKEVGCFGGQDGSITIAATPDNASLQYSWTGPDGPLSGSFTTTASGLKAGTYSVTITDPTPDPDVTYTISGIIVTQPSKAVSATLRKQDITCNGASNGILDTEADGGTLPYIYEWKKGEEVLSATTEVISNLSAGSYTVTVTDVNGCNFPVSGIISEPDALVFSAIPVITPVTCNAAKNDGSIKLSVSGGTGSLTYKWSNGVTTDQSYLGLLAAGTYSCTVTDSKNCTISTQQKVTQPDPITATITITNISCYGGSNGKIVLDPQGGNGSYTYAWSNNSDTKDMSGLLPGTYSVVVKDANGCEKSFSSTIAAPTTDIVISQTAKQDANCFGSATGSMTVDATGAAQPLLWSWSNAKIGATVSNLVAGDYTVTLIDGKNCTKSALYHIDEPTELSISEDVLLHKDIACNGASTGALAVTASGSSGSYAYSLNGSDWQTENSFDNLPAGEYTISVRDQTVPVCQKSMAPAVSITEPALIQFSSPAISNISCNGFVDGAINAPATGGTGSLSYKLKIDGNESDNTSGASNGIFLGLGAGNNYTIEAVDANNCLVSTEALSIADAPALKVSGITPANATCAGSNNGSLSVAASGNGILNYKLLLNGTPTGNTSGAASGSFTGLGAAAGYAVEVNDGNNCGPLLSESVTITEPLQVSITLQEATKTSGAGSNDGIITIAATGGTSPLSFTLNTGVIQNTGLFTNLPSGNYSVTVTDANQCAAVVSNTLTVDNSTGLNIINGMSIRLYPNPVTEKVFIKISDSEFKELKVDLKNISGQATLTRTFENVSSGFTTDIDLSDIPKGIYVIMVNNVALKEKLIVQ
ncbi:MAG TPA: T9SS type A sorting domain-containing protein [Bacteroidales bacterium]|nr:T9SS type A sorting domain-containing protein [Bacteroidales bacterium]